jgi:hypothetical protein
LTSYIDDNDDDDSNDDDDNNDSDYDNNDDDDSDVYLNKLQRKVLKNLFSIRTSQKGVSTK